MPCIFNLTFLPLANISGHPSLSLSSHSSCPFISDDWLRYVPFHSVSCVGWSSRNFRVLLTWWSSRKSGMLGLDLLHERFYLSEQIRCGFIDLCRNNKNSAEDFLSILPPNIPLSRFVWTYHLIKYWHFSSITWTRVDLMGKYNQDGSC